MLAADNLPPSETSSSKDFARALQGILAEASTIAAELTTMEASKLRATVNCDMGEVSVEFVQGRNQGHDSGYGQGKVLCTSSKGSSWSKVKKLSMEAPTRVQTIATAIELCSSGIVHCYKTHVILMNNICRDIPFTRWYHFQLR